ncbi:acyltransferase [Desulfovibrio litoralis]|uniref:Galactoside O-acetyltransferase n=1 Tax=Desulfovibrio litoralis DSM 11393 TaxID=1121455 RepID=A0A1M7TQH4_9BACT|nr:acyltransferase [Desulfovibrio litoralis]SHN72982.1 galactoside O-acetyltransferase [Desulfovibrio litoralis DSM 11393]
MSSFYSLDELKTLGFKSIGNNVLLSKKASFYSPETISFGDNVRVDDFCVLSGEITTGNYVHISAYVACYAKAGLRIGNFCGISPRSSIYTVSDDFSGEYMISPMVPDNLTKLRQGRVVLENYTQLGANSIVMPGVKLKEGAVSGAFSLVLKDLDEWTINFGIPCKFYQHRKKDIIKLSEKIL